MPFEALGEDVLLGIFCLCDISTVLAVSGINKALRRIALSKQLWLAMVLDKKFRDALELPPPNRAHLECLSTEELIAVVKNAVNGPCSIWDSALDESSVTMTSFQIPLDDMENRPEARLLPGARYLVLHSTSTTQQGLYLYDVWSARRVWHRLMQAHKMCEVDLVPGGAIARVFFVQTVDHPNTYMLHVKEVDLKTGASHELFNFSLDRTVFGATPCAIVGDFLLAALVHSHSLLVLINWRASTFVSLSRDGLSYVQLIPGYILSTYRETSPPHGYILTATGLEAFSDRWQPLPDDSTGLAAQLEAGSASTITIESLDIATQERLEYINWQIRSSAITATPHPLCAGAYNIAIYGRQFSERPPRPATLMERIGNLVLLGARALLSYRFMPGQAQASCELRLVSAQRLSNELQAEFPRAIPRHSGNSISVVYRQRRGPGADVA
ncbi:hypothetical protein MSAN_01529600 [Mycena sanguinolenta]|uniref:F-box domain-containing protein n=1 Tax=Mycena sanguinolenta TaxID=230812 RepID=A0A8H6Y7P2_9AGAR|nr:hypothetical protein MSAN_01529600 [Mycena sanguinolenta]